MTSWRENDLTIAWRALLEKEVEQEWQYIGITQLHGVAICAACNFPAKREALIVVLPKIEKLTSGVLPEGKGFDVVLIESEEHFGSDSIAVALIRKHEGAIDIFATITIDILRTMENSRSKIDVIDVLLKRMKEWQSFMSKTRKPLSHDAQIGLLAELLFLKTLTETPMGNEALNCWQGPFHAAQDFHIKDGAVEVKATVKSDKFVAKISSIEQLDSEKAPFFLCAYRFKKSDVGISLVDTVILLRQYFLIFERSRSFEAALLIIGYFKEHETNYLNKYEIKDISIFSVDENMPRLTRDLLPNTVMNAIYTLNIDAFTQKSLNMYELLKEFILQP